MYVRRSRRHWEKRRREDVRQQVCGLSLLLKAANVQKFSCMEDDADVIGGQQSLESAEPTMSSFDNASYMTTASEAALPVSSSTANVSRPCLAPSKSAVNIGRQPTATALSPNPKCAGCGFEIAERFLLRVSDDYWHENCLVCFCCGARLSQCHSCFVKDGRVFCEADYQMMFWTKCARCGEVLSPSELVYRCMANCYHVRCFGCAYCGQALCKGEQYLVLDAGQLICRQDYELLLCNPAMTPAAYCDSDCHRKTAKRPRTILSSSQRRAFKASFELSSKPCRKVREQLAKETGLSVRVVQVWFQNQRAKMKKIQRKHDQQQQKQQQQESLRKSASVSSSNGAADRDPTSPKSENDSTEMAKSPDSTVVDEEDSDQENETETVVAVMALRGSQTKGPSSAAAIPSLAMECYSTAAGSDQLQPNSSVTPIDRLYSMQNAYFYS